MQINARDARQRFSELLDRAESGEEIVVTRRGRPAVCLVAEGAERARRPLPDLSDFRASITMKGSLTETVLAERRDERDRAPGSTWTRAC